MDDVTPAGSPPRVPPIEPDLLGSAIFLFSEYLQNVADLKAVEEDPENEPIGEDDDEEEEETSPINMREVLDLFAEELGTGLLAASPSLARMAAADEESGGLSEDALVAFARLDLHVTRTADGVVAEFDPRELRHALAGD
jgi:hypothetical protein